MAIRQNLRSKLLNGHITLFRYMRSKGALSSKVDSHAKFVTRLAEEALRVEADAQVDKVDAVVLDAASDRFQPTNSLERHLLT